MRKKTETKYQALIDLVGRERKSLPFTLSDGDHEIGILRIKEIIDKTTDTIFNSYREKLLTEPITYIVPAVWGEKKDGKLTVTQKEINRKIVPMISNIMAIFELEDINRAQRFAIGYLIRGLVTSKITYMIEASRNRAGERIKRSKTKVKSIAPIKLIKS